MSDTPRTDSAIVSAEYIRREMDYYKHKFILADHARDLERELTAALEAENAARRGVDGELNATKHILEDYKKAHSQAVRWQQHYLERAEKAEAELAAIKEERLALAKECVEAWESAVEWSGYASDYFREKHGVYKDQYRLDNARDRLVMLEVKDEATLWRHGEKTLAEALAGFEGKPSAISDGVRVPREPTDAMLQAALAWREFAESQPRAITIDGVKLQYRSVYRAMLAAAQEDA